MANNKYYLVILADDSGTPHVVATKQQGVTLDEDDDKAALRLGTQELVRIATDAHEKGFKVRRIELMDRKFQPLDEEESRSFQTYLLTNFREGKSDALRRFFRDRGRGVFISNIEFESPRRELFTLERKGILRAGDEAKQQFLPVLEHGLAGV